MVSPIRRAQRRGPRGLTVGEVMYGIEADAQVAVVARDSHEVAALAYVRPQTGPLRAYTARGEAIVPERLRELVEHVYFAERLSPETIAHLRRRGQHVALSPRASPEERRTVVRTLVT